MGRRDQDEEQEVKQSYKSDIELGQVYTDDQTGFVGTATAIYFFQHACERVSLEAKMNSEGKIIENTFDAPRLRKQGTTVQARSTRPGGPARAGEGNRPGL
jgi:hypothetical protein